MYHYFVEVGPPLFKLLRGTSYDNPFLSDLYGPLLMEIYGGIDSALAKRYILGEMGAFEGSAIPFYNPAVHRVAMPRDFPPEWDSYVSIDFGYANPFVALLARRSPDGVWYITAEHYKSQMLLREHAVAIQKIEACLPYGVSARVADHDAQDRAELEALGLGTLAATKDRISGYHQLAAKFAVDPTREDRWLASKGVRVPASNIYIDLDCVNTCREVAGVHYPEVDAMRETPRDVKDEVVKKEDHTTDALYMLFLTIEGNMLGKVVREPRYDYITDGDTELASYLSVKDPYADVPADQRSDIESPWRHSR